MAKRTIGIDNDVGQLGPRPFLDALGGMLDKRKGNGRSVLIHIRTGEWPPIARPQEFSEVLEAVGDGSVGMFSNDRALATEAAAVIAAHLASYAPTDRTRGPGRKRKRWSHNQVHQLLQTMANAAEKFARPAGMTDAHPAAVCVAYLAFGAPWRLLRGPTSGDDHPCWWEPSQRMLAATGCLDFYALAYRNSDLSGLRYLPECPIPEADFSGLQGMLAAWWARGLLQHGEPSLEAARRYVQQIVRRYADSSEKSDAILQVVCDAAGLLYEIDMHPDLLDERLCGARDRYGSVRWMLQGVVSARVVDNLIAAKTLHAPTAHPRTPCTGQRRIALVFLKNGLYESADGGKTLTCITGQSAFDTRRSNRYASYRRAMDAIYLSASPRDVRTLISETAYHGDTQRHIHLINLLVRRHFITAYRIDIGQASPITVRYRKQDGVGVLLNPFWRLDHAFAPNPALFAQ